VIHEKEEAHKEEIAALKAQQDVVSEALLALCNDQNLDSIRTAAGTVTRSTITRFWTSDWESMYQFIRDRDAPFLLEQRIHNGNMRQFLEDNPEEFCYLMDAEYPEEAFPDGIEDYDYWDGYDYLTVGNTPATIIAWLNSLPEYDMEVGD